MIEASENPDENEIPPYADRTRECEEARTPFHLPPGAWWRVIRRVVAQIGSDALGVIAAGCAFFGLLAIFPALSAIAILYGLTAEPSDVVSHFSNFRAVVPKEALQLLTDQAERLASTTKGTLGWGLVISLLLALFGATRTVRSLLAALNVTYDEQEQRGFFALNLQIAAITFAGLVLFILIQIAIAVVPAFLRMIWLGDGMEMFLGIARWPVLGLVLTGALAFLFRLAPSRANAQWSWVLPGAIFAAIGWIGASVLFSLYVSFFGNYSAFYGSLGAVVILLLWMYWSFLIILLGSELNAELEHEVARDTTAGKAHPLGKRDAAMADRVAGGHLKD